MNYPVYRKYKNLEVWFKISDENHFIEIKKLGSNYLLSEITANQFPEKLLIQDMIAMHENRWEEVSGDVFETLLKQVKV